jgi:hypothetical protein
MEAIHTAKTAQELLQAQEVVLPLLLDLPLPQTARGLGVCATWVGVLRRRFAKAAKGKLCRRRPAKVGGVRI